jgi:hypothetical protein
MRPSSSQWRGGRISVATCVFPATLVVANAAVALIIFARRTKSVATT